MKTPDIYCGLKIITSLRSVSLIFSDGKATTPAVKPPKKSPRKLEVSIIFLHS
jgi:hypothetical protein